MIMHVMYVDNVLYVYSIYCFILYYVVICDPPCAHGACVANNTCNCAKGYSGARCTEPGMCTWVPSLPYARDCICTISVQVLLSGNIGLNSELTLMLLHKLLDLRRLLLCKWHCTVGPTQSLLLCVFNYLTRISQKSGYVL